MILKKLFPTNAMLRSYFYSGWAFLIPYLAVYLLYYVTKWPVNQAAVAAAGQGSEVIGQGLSTNNPSPITPNLIPSLLHVYWTLHAIHLILAAIALRSWWRMIREPEVRSQASNVGQTKLNKVQSSERSNEITRTDLPTIGYLPPATILIRLTPWLLLALLFYIPGVYLEWPSDPWEHLRRINEWRILETVGAHSSWYKSAYFIPYSMLSWCIGLRQLFWLDFYYTGICLLLSWQYYKFSRACGLGERASMVFVIIQAMLFGNNIFSFYRYYGISSSIYAQLGAIALTRIILEYASWGKTNIHHGGTEDSEKRPSFWHLPSLYWLLTRVSCLLVLTALNHTQGIGIAALGITAIVAWRLIEWKRRALWWLIGGTIIVNALFLALYPRPAIIETYSAQGYLNAWYGFNILNLTSPAGDRMLQIINGYGILNFAVSLVLLSRNYSVAWITVFPILCFLCPCWAIPFSALANIAGGETNVITFQRMLFAIVPYLAITNFGQLLLNDLTKRKSLSQPMQGPNKTLAPMHYLFFSACILLAIGLFMPIKTNKSFLPWHTLAKTPEDLTLRTIIGGIEDYFPEIYGSDIAATSGICWAFDSQGMHCKMRHLRNKSTPSDDLSSAQNMLRYSPPPNLAVISAKPTFLFTTHYSFAAGCSNHWLPTEAAFLYSGNKEFKMLSKSMGFRTESNKHIEVHTR